MSSPILVQASDIIERVWPGGGKGKRLIAPETGSMNLMIGVISVDPGKSPHRWHTHSIDRFENSEIVYPDNFEEAYFIIKG